MSLKERNLSSPLMWNAGVVPECLYIHHRPLVVMSPALGPQSRPDTRGGNMCDPSS